MVVIVTVFIGLIAKVAFRQRPIKSSHSQTGYWFCFAFRFNAEMGGVNFIPSPDHSHKPTDTDSNKRLIFFE